MINGYYYNEEEAYQLRMQEQAYKQYQRLLWAHPDCRDPDHPGCEDCEEDWIENDE